MHQQTTSHSDAMDERFHQLSDPIAAIVRGRQAGFGLGREVAETLFEAMFDGGLDQRTTDAILTALGMGEPSIDELCAGVSVVSARLQRVAVDPSRPLVTLACADGQCQAPAALMLLACLLSGRGLQVVMHGPHPDAQAVFSARVIQAMGLGSCTTTAEASRALSRGFPAFVPLHALAPALDRMLVQESRLGIPGVSRLLLRLLDPGDAPVCLRIVDVAAPDRARLLRSALLATGGRAILMRPGDEGQSSGRRRWPQLEWLREGRAAGMVGLAVDSAGEWLLNHDVSDPVGTARWIQSVLAGERPVPDAVFRQMEATLGCLGLEAPARDD